MSIADTLYTAAAVRELDRRAIEEHQIPGIVLMKRAGAAALADLLERWPLTTNICVLCGGGNNGGDGYIIAALARQRGMTAQVLQLAASEKLRGDALRAYRFASDAGVQIKPFAGGLDSDADVIVDALLGTGVAGQVRPAYAEAIRAINRVGKPVLAVDIPSGLCSDTGAARGEVVSADLTATFIGMKIGLFTGRGPAFCGEVVFHDLDVPPAVYSGGAEAALRLNLPALMTAWPPRQRDAHKGKYGHVLVIGGDSGFGGAAAMAAEAALRVGAGLVGVATRSAHVAAMLARRPELMVKPVESGQALEPLLVGPTVLVVGPGLGRSAWSEQVLQQAINAQLPMVVDADALNILGAGHVGKDTDMSRWVLTPHPGEAARLLDTDNAAIQRDRPAACRALQQRYPGVVLLKGAGTLIATDDGALTLCPYGNPGMAAGGMGDILAGVIGGLLAQGLDARYATQLGACVHAAAADRVAASAGERGMLATDLLAPLAALVNGR